jgi:hypothetical protein
MNHQRKDWVNGAITISLRCLLPPTGGSRRMAGAGPLADSPHPAKIDKKCPRVAQLLLGGEGYQSGQTACYIVNGSYS